ncbi:hypothetical protein KC722_00235 [Candidatus Kaiserbacteria bacterium]|nr:hypothetical protein [Candidatus Kaiserbacteria bacterium]MCB9811315.1 hypothetical protein [Candidatus Nomurabacteria bacterium]
MIQALQRFIASGLVLAVLLSAAPPSVRAATSTDEEELTAQLSAVRTYFARWFAPEEVTPLSVADLRSIIDAGVTWTLNAIDEDGHFAYEYAPYEGAYVFGDNIVRQAGTLYVLGEVYRRQETKSTKLETSLERVIEHFTDLSKAGEASGTEFRCLVASASAVSCKLGASSLALLGLLGYLEVHGGDAPEEYAALAKDYLAYILASQKDSGGFRDEYRVGEGFRESESPYSNGEALLALVRYYQYDPVPEIKTAIDKAFTYLKDKPFESPLYLWIMAALKDMQQLWPNAAYVTYAKEFTDWRTFYASGFDRYKNYCAYNEGLTSAYGVLEDEIDSGYLQTLRHEINTWNYRNQQLQLGAAHEYRLVVGDTGTQFQRITEPSLAYGGFLTSEHTLTQRIDFTQHCLSSYLQTLLDIEDAEI